MAVLDAADIRLRQARARFELHLRDRRQLHRLREPVPALHATAAQRLDLVLRKHGRSMTNWNIPVKS